MTSYGSKELSASSFHFHDNKGNKIDDLKQVNFPELMQQVGAEEARPRDTRQMQERMAQAQAARAR